MSKQSQLCSPAGAWGVLHRARAERSPVFSCISKCHQRDFRVDSIILPGKPSQDSDTHELSLEVEEMEFLGRLLNIKAYTKFAVTYKEVEVRCPCTTCVLPDARERGG